MMSRSTRAYLGLMAVTLPSLVGQSYAADQPSENIAQSSLIKQDGPAILSERAQAQEKSASSIEACWSAWLSKEGLVEGKNPRGSDFILVNMAKEEVSADEKASQWLAARNAAFQTAEIGARQALSNSLDSAIRSDRTTVAHALGDSATPLDLQGLAKPLSIASKIDILTDAALDDEIRKFKPDWDGSGISAQQKRDRLVKTRTTSQDFIASHSMAYVSGAFTAKQCEGFDEQGKYAVLVGMIWSPRLAGVAESIWNPQAPKSPVAANRSLKAQFDGFTAADPDWLAVSLGSRVFTDENGNRVVVGFGAAPQTASSTMDVSRANLRATAAIQRFVGEKIESNKEERQALQKITSLDDRLSIEDTSSYDDITHLYSREENLQGVTQIMDWRGNHPYSGAKMQVVAVAWTAAWAADARRTATSLQLNEGRMQRQGAVPSIPGQSEGSSGSGIPARSGAESSTSDF